MCLPLPRFILKESGLARYLHSAVLIGGVLLVFGGNTHNDTSLSNGAKCFSSDFLSYDIGMNHLWPPFFDHTSTSLKVKCRIIIIVILHKFPVVIFVKNNNSGIVWKLLHLTFNEALWYTQLPHFELIYHTHYDILLFSMNGSSDVLWATECMHTQQCSYCKLFHSSCCSVILLTVHYRKLISQWRSTGMHSWDIMEFLGILLTYASDTHTGCSDFMCGVCNQIFGGALMEDLPVQNL